MVVALKCKTEREKKGECLVEEWELEKRRKGWRDNDDLSMTDDIHGLDQKEEVEESPSLF